MLFNAQSLDILPLERKIYLDPLTCTDKGIEANDTGLHT